MGGAVVELRVREGDTVAAGDTVLIISAMKMETLRRGTVLGHGDRRAAA